MEERLDQAAIVFEGRLVKYEEEHIDGSKFPEFKKDKVPVVVQILKVEKNWKGAEVGQQIKLTQGFFPFPELIDDKNWGYRFPEQPKDTPKQLFVLGPRANFFEEEVVYATQLCPTERFTIDDATTELLKKKFPQGATQ